MERPQTVAELRAAGWSGLPVKEELRRNLVRLLRAGAPLFPGLFGYEDTVVPEVVHALLSRHDLLLLGPRGQAKTRLLRSLTAFLDDALPVLAGSEVRDHPFAPLSAFGRDLLAREGGDAPVAWVGRDERFVEKLATPDVTVADLLGDVDLIKHAGGLTLADERVLHYGLLPRSNRGLFCVNELPDLSPRVQVALFNVLQERDVQIRGFAVRLPLDVCLTFSANPEDYTSRGRIVTPLKDRIGSVVRTHYPPTRAVGMAISNAQAFVARDTVPVLLPDFMKAVVEETARLARTSPAVRPESGVSVRLSIANLEVLASSAERRALLLGEAAAAARVSDLSALEASSRGKLELALGDEDETEDELIRRLFGAAVRTVFLEAFDPVRLNPVVDWFRAGGRFVTGDRLPLSAYEDQLRDAPVLREAAERFDAGAADTPEAAAALRASVVEFLLEGLHRTARIGKTVAGGRASFGGV